MLSRSRCAFALVAFCLIQIASILPGGGTASAQPVTLSLAPGSAVATTIEVITDFGSDIDGPTPVGVSGTADALLSTSVDPTHGLVALTLAFTSSDLEFADTDFQVTIFVPVDISLVGIKGIFSPDSIGPGNPVSAGTSEFDPAPIAIEWTEGEIVAIEPPGTPAAGVTFPLVGTAVVTTTPNGGTIDVTVTLPVSSVDSVTEAGITVVTTLSGSLILTGSYMPPGVPALGDRMQIGLIAILVAVGLGMLARRRFRCSADLGSARS